MSTFSSRLTTRNCTRPWVLRGRISPRLADFHSPVFCVSLPMRSIDPPPRLTATWNHPVSRSDSKTPSRAKAEEPKGTRALAHARWTSNMNGGTREGTRSQRDKDKHAWGESNMAVEGEITRSDFPSRWNFVFVDDDNFRFYRVGRQSTILCNVRAEYIEIFKRENITDKWRIIHYREWRMRIQTSFSERKRECNLLRPSSISRKKVETLIILSRCFLPGKQFFV